jgi:hypothetical protein
MKIFKIDGSDHEVGGDCCQFWFGQNEDRQHKGCGGFWHYQPVYNGYVYQCDKCKQKAQNPNEED